MTYYVYEKRSTLKRGTTSLWDTTECVKPCHEAENDQRITKPPRCVLYPSGPRVCLHETRVENMWGWGSHSSHLRVPF